MDCPRDQMTTGNHNLTRRRFLQALAGGGIGALLAGNALAARIAASLAGTIGQTGPDRAQSSGGIRSGKPRVVIVHDPGMLSEDWKTDDDAVHRATSEAVRLLTGATTEAKAWGTLYSPGDRVGIKVNCLGGPRLCTHAAVARAVALGLVGAGVGRSAIVIWDRQDDELTRCGYKLDASRRPAGVRCFGTDHTAVGYEPDLRIHESVASRLSRILTEYCTKQVNLPLTKDHDVTGITCAMKNWLGAIHNPNKFHATRGDPQIADLGAMPAVRGAAPLIICDALVVQHEGGPSADPRHMRRYNAIMAATDPVALDTLVESIIERHRQEAGLPALVKAGRPPKYLDTAADDDHALGVRDLAGIEMIEKTIS